MSTVLEAYPVRAPLVIAPALLENIRVGQKYLPLTNTLAYDSAVIIVTVKIL